MAEIFREIGGARKGSKFQFRRRVENSVPQTAVAGIRNISPPKAWPMAPPSDVPSRHHGRRLQG
jgi:hypothetical protein